MQTSCNCRIQPGRACSSASRRAAYSGSATQQVAASQAIPAVTSTARSTGTGTSTPVRNEREVEPRHVDPRLVPVEQGDPRPVHENVARPHVTVNDALAAGGQPPPRRTDGPHPVGRHRVEPDVAAAVGREQLPARRQSGRCGHPTVSSCRRLQDLDDATPVVAVARRPALDEVGHHDAVDLAPPSSLGTGTGTGRPAAARWSRRSSSQSSDVGPAGGRADDEPPPAARARNTRLRAPPGSGSTSSTPRHGVTDGSVTA